MINKSDLPKFNPNIYTKIILNDLVVFSIQYLHSKNTEVTSEDIVSACFMLFPKRFSLRNHPHWPDSAMVSRHWSVCRSKGYIAVGAESGFKLTAKGVRLAENVAQSLGVAMPKHAAKGQPSQPKVRAVKPAKKVQLVVRKEKTTRSAAVKKIQHSGPKAHAITSTQKAKTVQKKKAALPVLAKKTRPLRSKVRVVTQTKKAQSAQKEKITEIAHKERVDQRPVIEKTRASRSKVHAVTQAKKAQPVQKEKEVPPALIKKVSLVRSRKVPSAKKEKIAEIAQKEKAVLQSAIRKTRSPRSKTRPVTQGKTTKPVPIKKITPSKPVRNVQPVRPAAPVPSKKRRDDTAGGARKARPRTLLKNVRPIWTEKIKPPEPVVRSVITGKAQLIQPEKTFQPAQSNVTPEIKIRAGKFVHLMEKSDAYIHYKKNGKSSKISEFDFRSLLLCTMESSPETLARNVEKFKGYAGIHNRQDLVVFLNFCAEKLSYLLAPQIKRSTKPARRKMK